MSSITHSPFSNIDGITELPIPSNKSQHDQNLVSISKTALWMKFQNKKKRNDLHVVIVLYGNINNFKDWMLPAYYGFTHSVYSYVNISFVIHSFHSNFIDTLNFENRTITSASNSTGEEEIETGSETVYLTVDETTRHRSKEINHQRREINSLSPLKLVSLEEMAVPPLSSYDTSMVQYQSDGDDVVMNQYKRGALGGTFDHMHIGHKLLLTQAALAIQEELVIGITSGELLKNKSFASVLFPFEKRRDDVTAFLHLIRPGIEIRPVEIHDPAGPTVEETDLQVLVLSQETESGLESINKKREEKGMPPMAKVVVPCIGVMQRKISSTDLRKLEQQYSDQ
eukprot:gb/GECH01001351.1/.p1 GENE.gb/GECH01001351.1/~~gb/GECH01001351.1/.p1  ORF type:complete len:340 (+),score=75.60 gb/GECH01001351.1/:1-1020(+)